ncbi:uncharacterized protein LOC127258388 [Andrographis paniculata]|uniref:uncharacterized protein LOC127258388 n=1 Tax=Andrographis paniculata TaxID=175694 RepID=UPI0021E85ED3|nr:uncharacterized protein LOC127258388 [Andrographis paniculata]
MLGNMKNEDVSMREFWAFRFQHRMEGTTLLRGGRLFQQLAVDCYSAIEQHRLNYIKTHQAKLRVDLYQGLTGAVVVGDTDASAVGMRISLPSSFTGGPRNMLQHYHDALAICRAIEPPDFFITLTCNPKWVEISRDLSKFPNQCTEDRPDILARVFRMKHKEMLRLLKDKMFFGQAIADVHVIDFKKRGLPHSHITLTLQDGFKPITSEEIDRYICAEIPDKNVDPLAYNIVTRQMVHGPCGVYNLNAPCMVDGKCSKHYPKKFYPHTTIDKNGFVSYRYRCDPSKTFSVNGVKMDNRWIFPYNRDLLVLFNAHINVEKCASPKLMKYMYKYMCKGTDRAIVSLKKNVKDAMNNEQRHKRIDEFKQYVDFRYISAIEACWRIYKFELQKYSPAVERLQFHLPNQQFVVFHERESLVNVVDRFGVQHTMLTRWFEANKNNVAARRLTYVNFSSEWVWRKNTKDWVTRQKGRSIGRLPYAHPGSWEKYYLRMLLYIVCGAQSFEDLWTFNGYVYSTFKQACAARGLLDDDNEWHEALSEASSWASSSKLRNMFATMLMFYELTNPVNLWEQHWRSMVDDLLYNLRRESRNDVPVCDMDLKDWGLQEIELILSKNGRSLADFPPMPQPSSRSFSYLSNRLIREELDYNASNEKQLFHSLHAGLNIDQLRAYNEIIEAYEGKHGGLFFVNGSGGTGKTYLWKTIVLKFRSQRKIVLSVASSGIAVLLLPGGRTAHSRFKIPIELDESSHCSINLNSNLAHLIREYSLIIWDEAPMMHHHGFEAVNRTLQDILKSSEIFCRNKPFGGKLCILGGDFKQILPVVTKGRREAIVEAYLHNSELWNQCKVIHL